MQLAKAKQSIYLTVGVYEIFSQKITKCQLHKLIKYTDKVEKRIVELRIGGVGENSNGDAEAGAQGSKLRRKHL